MWRVILFPKIDCASVSVISIERWVDIVITMTCLYSFTVYTMNFKYDFCFMLCIYIRTFFWCRQNITVMGRLGLRGYNLAVWNHIDELTVIGFKSICSE